jgi:hypothetical protein
MIRNIFNIIKPRNRFTLRYFSSPSMTATNTNAIDANGSSGKHKWYVLSGFSNFCTRFDLEMVLGTEIQPLAIDPLLDRNLYPSGKYALLLTNSQFEKLKSLLRSKGSDKYNLYDDSILKNWKRSSLYNITTSTIRTRFKPENIALEDLEYFLEGYQLANNSNNSNIPVICKLKDLPTNSSSTNSSGGNGFNSQYLIQLASPSEAERVLMEKDGTMIDGVPVSFLWYQA